MAIDLRKKISLAKQDVAKVCLSKGLDGRMFRVASIVDVSGSTYRMFKTGLMQDVIERTLPISLQFDDDGELDSWIFSSASRFSKGFHRLPMITLDNIGTYINKFILPKHGGGTQYAPVLQDVYAKYILEEPSQTPAFILFYTDGDNENSDKSRTEDIIRKLSKHNIFIQFVGIGNDSKEFLAERLNNLDDTYIDNCGFCDLTDIGNMDNMALYNALLNELPDWVIKAQRVELVP